MNKLEQREVSKIIAYMPHLGVDYAARALSALHRASMRANAKAEILAVAQSVGATASAEWLI